MLAFKLMLRVRAENWAEHHIIILLHILTITTQTLCIRKLKAFINTMALRMVLAELPAVVEKQSTFARDCTCLYRLFPSKDFLRHVELCIAKTRIPGASVRNLHLHREHVFADAELQIADGAPDLARCNGTTAVLLYEFYNIQGGNSRALRIHLIDLRAKQEEPRAW